MERLKIDTYRSNVRASRNIIGSCHDIFREAGSCYDLELVSKALQLRAQVHKLDQNEIPLLPLSFETNETFGILEQGRLEQRRNEREKRMAEAPDVLDDAELREIHIRCSYRYLKDKVSFHLRGK